MADRHVEPGKDGWRVIKEGGTRASATTSTRGEAIERARQIIANDGGGELVIHADGGNIVDRERVQAAGRERTQAAANTGSTDTTDAPDAPDAPETGQHRQDPPRRLQDEVEEKILDAGRTAASTAKQLADQGRSTAKDVIGKLRGRLGR